MANNDPALLTCAKCFYTKPIVQFAPRGGHREAKDKLQKTCCECRGYPLDPNTGRPMWDIFDPTLRGSSNYLQPANPYSYLQPPPPANPPSYPQPPTPANPYLYATPSVPSNLYSYPQSQPLMNPYMQAQTQPANAPAAQGPRVNSAVQLCMHLSALPESDLGLAPGCMKLNCCMHFCCATTHVRLQQEGTALASHPEFWTNRPGWRGQRRQQAQVLHEPFEERIREQQVAASLVSALGPLIPAGTTLECNYESNFPLPHARLSDKQWPVGYPAQAQNDFAKGGFRVGKGDFVLVVDFDKARKAVHVQLPDSFGVPGADEWMPQAQLYIGAHRPFGKWWVWVDVERLRQTHRQITVPPDTENVLAKTILLWLQVLRRDIDRIPFGTTWFSVLLHSDASLERIFIGMLNGINQARMVDLLNKPDFQHYDFLDRAPQALTGEEGTYLLVGVGGELELGVVYTGVTGALPTETGGLGGFFNRFQGHERGVAQALTLQYQELAKADYWAMVPVSISNDPQIRCFTEQFFTSFLGTYFAWAVDGRAEVRDLKELADERGQNWAVSKAHALVMQSIEEEVSKATGFARGTQRLSFGATGLNTKSPLSEGGHSLSPFVKTSGPTSATYRRTAGTYNPTSRMLRFYFTQTTGVLSIQPAYTLSAEQEKQLGIKNGAKYDWVFDIRKDGAPGSPHPLRMFPLPEVGDSSNHALALTLAGGFEVVGSDGHRYRLPWQYKGTVSNAEMCRAATAIVRFCQREKLLRAGEGPRYIPIYDFSVAPIYEVKVANLAQCYRIVAPRQSTPAQPPTKKSKDQIWEELKARGAGSRGSKDHWRKDRRCDAVTLNGMPDIPKRVTDDSCEFCEAKGWLCTWTAGIETVEVQLQKRELCAALMPHTIMQHRLLDMGVAAEVTFQ
ncbi:hypothetical protein LTR27_004307 [Elasticomyces elasticus]|nr:hypothetical protein LTR27_004307 [Elasticomyces elasticus]